MGLRLIPGFEELPRVTSDCLPFAAGGSLAVCELCGGVQKIPDQRWHEEAAAIYRDYVVYRASDGVEMAVFNPATGVPRRRSDVILDHVFAQGRPAAGTFLDAGCGDGAMLRAASAALPGWQLDGVEMDDRHLARLNAIPGFRRLHTGKLSELSPGYDMVTLIHALEHFVEPVEVLRDIRGLLASSGGRLVVEVLHYAATPFDLVIADHLTHYTPQTLSWLLGRGGFRADGIATDWVPKELTAVASPGKSQGVADGAAFARVTALVGWMAEFLRTARQLAEAGPFAIFGTSIAAAWLFGPLGEKVACFVDEDPSRAGRDHLGRPVFAPRDVPAGLPVLLALAPAIATAVSSRLAGLPFKVILPPPMPAEVMQ
jgi:SAM-dependent methyltransferase